MEGETASSDERIIKFLKEFVPDQGSPTGEENLNIQLRSSIVGSYRLSQSDIYPEVLDWVSSYLDQKKCPNELSIVLSNEVANFMNDSFPIDVNKQDPEADFLFDSVLLYNSVLEKLIELCNNYQNAPDEILSKTRNVQSARFLTSVNAIKNGRRKMEDRHVVIHDLNALCGLEKSPPQSYYAIFDGHAGVEAASYAASHLHWNIVKHPAFASDLETAIKEAYIQTDEAFLERSKQDNIKSGCTAVTCIVRDKTLYVAWLGDSLAILVRQGMPISLVEPHKPDRPEERHRIEALGGIVAHVGTWRVNGTLAVSRAIGDIEHKPIVSGVPEMQKISLEGDEDFLVIGCDGLWDNMSPQDVSATVYSKATDLTADADTIASSIVQQSKNQGSTDNITAIVVLFRDRASLTQPVTITHHYKQTSGPFDPFTPNGRMENVDFGQDGPLSNNPFSQNWMDNPTESLESGKSIYVYNSGITVGDPIGANGPEEIFRPFTGVTLERTSISELPTPPIEDLAPTQQFSNLESLNSQNLDQSQSANPFEDVTDFSGRSAASFDSTLENNSVTMSNQESFDLMGGQVNISSEQTIISESQSSVMMSSQSGQSILSAVPESEDQVLASKPWVMQVEHSVTQNEVDYLPNPDTGDLPNPPVDLQQILDTSPDGPAPEIYDFSSAMNLEEVPLDIPVGAEVEASFHQNKSLMEQNQELVSSFSEEAHSTIRAIHGVQEMIGISESVPGSKAQDPPATAGNPFSDNPFNIQKTFDNDLANLEQGTREYSTLEQEIMEKNDTVGDLFGTSGAYVDHESLIESNVDPDDDIPEQEETEPETKVTALPDIITPVVDEGVKASTQDLDEPESVLENQQIPDMVENSALTQVPINNQENPTEIANIEDNSNSLLENLVETESQSSGEQTQPNLIENVQDQDIVPTQPENVELLASDVENVQDQDIVPTQPENVQLLASDVENVQDQDMVPTQPENVELLASDANEGLSSFITASPKSETDFPNETVPETSPTISSLQDPALEPTEDIKVVEDIVPSPVVETPVMDLLNETSMVEEEKQPQVQQEPNLLDIGLDDQLLMDAPVTSPDVVKGPVGTLESLTTPTQDEPISETIMKDDFSATFATQPETVKVDFSPTLSSEPTMAILSPIIAAIPDAEIISGAQDTLSAPVVQLGKIPDGVPEADGVTEDADSDSEKDGGWSYVKGSDGKPVEKSEKKEEKKTSTTSKSPIKKPATGASTLAAKKPAAKDATKTSLSSAKTLKPEDKAKKAPSAVAKTSTSTLTTMKKSTSASPADTIKRTAASAPVRSAAPASSKTLKPERPKTVGSAPTTTTLKSSKPATAGSASPKPLNSTTVRSTSTVKPSPLSSTKPATSTGLASKTAVSKAPGKTPETTSTLNKTRLTTTSTLGKNAAATRTTVAKTTGSATTTARAVGTKTTTGTTSTLTKTANSTTTASKTTTSATSRTAVSSTLSKVTKKPTTGTLTNATTKPVTDAKQTKEAVTKQTTRQTGTVGRTTSSTTSSMSKTSTIRNVSKTTTTGTLKSKTATTKTETVVKSVPKPIKKAANNMVNGNGEGVHKDSSEQPKELDVNVEKDQLKEGETIQAPVEAEKGGFEENIKETPAVDSGLASPESLESPQNGLVTNNASMQNDKNEIVFNQ